MKKTRYPKVGSDDGATLVEFTFVGLMFLVLLVVTVDLLRLSYNALTVQFVASHVLRSAVLGPSARPSTYDSQAGWIKGGIMDLAGLYGVSVAAGDIEVCSAPPAKEPACGDEFAEASKEIVAVRVRIDGSSFVMSGIKSLSSSPFRISALALARNEEW